MLKRLFFIFAIILTLQNCSKKEEVLYEPSKNIDAYKIYEEGYEAFEKGDYFYAEKKFTEAELLFPQSIWAPRAALMSAYSYYSNDLQRFISSIVCHLINF